MSATHFLTTNFGLTDTNIHDLSVALEHFSGFIAGGSALYWQLGEASPANQDLDIWIPTKTIRNPDKEEPMRAIAADIERAEECYEYTSKTKHAMSKLIKSFGYTWISLGGLRHSTENDKPFGRKPIYDIPYHSNPEFQKIVARIMDFVNPDTKQKIQVIYYYADADPISGFDLDICKIRAHPIAGDFKLILPAGMTAESIMKREMRITNFSYPPNLCRRILKYYDRGFVLLTPSGERISTDDIGEELVGLQ